MGFSFAAGLNLYATVAILGLASRFDWVQLPPQFKVFDNDIVIGAALVMYVIEFVADKVPWLDSVWDAVHTVIRPVGGALIAVATLGHANPTVQGLVALLGGTLAASTHLTKAGTRAVANASPEPFTNWFLSLSEDALVVGLGFLALKYPAAAALVVIICVVMIVMFGTWIVRALRRRWGQPTSVASA
jgi:putative Mn2+ efflux pump MntP